MAEAPHRSVILLTLLALCLLHPFTVLAQQDGPEEAAQAIEGEVIINKNLEIELPPAIRTFEKVPPPALDPKQDSPLQYKFRAYDIDLPDLPTQVRVLKLKEEGMPKAGSGNYLKAGLGNYFTPLLEVGLHNKEGGRARYGMRYRHLSSRFGPVDKENSGSGQNDLRLHGEYTGTEMGTRGQVHYRRDAGRFYGYPEGTPVLADTIRQIYQRFGFDLGVFTADIRKPLQFGFDAGIGHIGDRFDARETSFDIGFNTSYILQENLKTDLELDIWHARYKNPELISRTMVRMLPTFEITSEQLWIRGGINVVYADDTLNFKGKTHLYPVLDLRYDLEDWLGLFAGIRGDMEKVTLGSIADENLFIGPGTPIAHRSKRLEVLFGARGNILRSISFEAGLSMAAYKNFHFFANDTLDVSRFDVLYDGGRTRLVSPYLSLSTQTPGKYGASARIQYFAYSTEQVARPWHRPKFETDLSLWYLFYGKVKASADLFVYTGMIGPGWTVPGDNQPPERKLEPIVDMNLRFDYLFSDKFGLFLQFSNLFNNQNAYFSNYIRRGLIGMVGISANL
jgi:hypothetical protein